MVFFSMMISNLVFFSMMMSYLVYFSMTMLDLVYFSTTPPLPRAVLSCCRRTKMSGSSFPSPSFSFSYQSIHFLFRRSIRERAPVSWCQRRICQAGQVARRSDPLTLWLASPSLQTMDTKWKKFSDLGEKSPGNVHFREIRDLQLVERDVIMKCLEFNYLCF